MRVPLMSGAISKGSFVSLRNIESEDLERISEFAYTVSIIEPLTDIDQLRKVFEQTKLWLEEKGAVSILENTSGRMIGTLQYYRASPCIHGLEIGYIIHNQSNRNKGFAAEALRLLSDHLFFTSSHFQRQQLLIEVWNTASWKVAERCGFIREGIMRSGGFGTDPADEFIYSRTIRDYREEKSSNNGALSEMTKT